MLYKILLRHKYKIWHFWNSLWQKIFKHHVQAVSKLLNLTLITIMCQTKYINDLVNTKNAHVSLLSLSFLLCLSHFSYLDLACLPYQFNWFYFQQTSQGQTTICDNPPSWTWHWWPSVLFHKNFDHLGKLGLVKKF